MIESLLELNKNVHITFCYGDIEDVLTDIIKHNKIKYIFRILKLFYLTKLNEG